MTSRIVMEPGMVYRLNTGFRFLVMTTSLGVCGRDLDVEEGRGYCHLREDVVAVETLEDRRVQFDKKYQTRSGLPARILATDLESDYCVVAAVCKNGRDRVFPYLADGSQYCTRVDEDDLVEVLPVTFEPDEVVEIRILGCGAWERAHYKGLNGPNRHLVWRDGRSSKTAKSYSDYDTFVDGNIRKLAE